MSRTPTKPRPVNKSPIKLCFHGLTPDELILNLRKHTIPAPFTLQSSHRNCRAQLEKKTLKILAKKEPSPESQNSTARLFSFSTNKLKTKRVSIGRTSIQGRPSSCSPIKTAKILQSLMAERSKAKKEKELKRIVAGLKSQCESKLQVSPRNICKKKVVYTLNDIFSVSDKLNNSEIY